MEIEKYELKLESKNKPYIDEEGYTRMFELRLNFKEQLKMLWFNKIPHELRIALIELVLEDLKKEVDE